MRFYLAGGFRSRWQDRARAALRGHEVLDPSQHNFTDPATYTEWDLNAIRMCDVVMAYMEASNPAGYALALEVGYARALGKKILLIEEHPSEERRRHFSMIRAVADHRFDSLDSALQFVADHAAASWSPA